MKRLGPFLLALLLGCGIIAGAASRANAELAVGLNADWYDLNGSQEEPNWEVLEQTGTNRLRVQFDWGNVVESGWKSTYDRYVEKAALHGITLVAMLYGGKANSPQMPVGTERTEWLSSFVTEAVHRYAQAGTFWTEFVEKHPSSSIHPITVWEVWNEPNRPFNNHSEKVDPGTYRELLKETSNTIHAAANSQQTPNVATVLFGGLLQSGSSGEAMQYFDEVTKGTGLIGWFDGLSIHPYNIGPNTRAARITGFEEKVTEARNHLSALCTECATTKSLWVTEFGWPVNGVEHSVSEHEQAELLSESFIWLRSKSAAYNLPLALWFDYRDTGGAPWDANCGLRALDGTYHESWWAFLTQTGHTAPGPANGVQMFLTASGEVYATSALGKGFAQETPAGETRIAAGGGNIQMLLDGAGQVWATSAVAGGWAQETPPGMVEISAGESLQMARDGAGQVWATTAIGTSWAQGTPAGETAIDAGGGGLEMLLDGAGQVWARNSVFGGWAQETPGGNRDVSAGGGGLEMLLAPDGSVWAASAIGGGFIQETPAGETAISAGEGGLQMILDGAGQVWAETGIGNHWTLESGPGQKAIAAGTGGLQMRLDSKGQVWAKGSIGPGGWALEAIEGEVAIAAG
jgi:hypothetical protein